MENNSNIKPIRLGDLMSHTEYMSKDEAKKYFGNEFVEQQLNNMENKTAPTLNERILGVLRKHEDNVTEMDTGIDDFKFPDVANSIEKLVLSTQIDLLKNILNFDVSDMPVYGGGIDIIMPANIKERLTELTNQLNQL